MAKVKTIIDPIGNTLNIWWKTPSKTDYVKESDTSNDVITYNKDGQPIGVEIIGLFPKELNITEQLRNNQVVTYLNGNNNFEKLSILHDRDRE